MRRSIALATLLVLLAAVAAAAACSGAGDAASPAPPAPPETGSPAAPSPPADPAAGTRLAPGLYDLEDGTVVAVGTVEHRDLEGGFWVVVDGTEAQGNAGEVVAVLTNGEEFAEQFRADQGLSFEVYGERAGEVSVRMAGPEVTAKSVVLAAEGGPAE